MNWDKLEEIVGEALPICLKNILNLTAYDSINSLKCLNKEKICEIEQYVSEFGLSLLNELDCCHSEKYKNKTSFKFLPGHRSILMSLATYAQKISEVNIDQKVVKSTDQCDESYSIVLRELIKSAQINDKKSKHQANYSDIIKYFCSFVYLTAGRASYEILQRNLPIPSTKTICE